jgi:ABC-type transport system involved in cytochrome bd biosynthesis fused ATPase/permease subunit
VSAIHEHAMLHLAVAVVKFLLVATGLALVFWFFYRQPQAGAAQARLATEICRSLVATWRFPHLAEAIYRTPLLRFRHFMRCAVSFAQRSQATNAKPDEVSALRDGYLKNRVEDQINHYRRQREKAHQFGPARERMAVIFSALATLATGLLVIVAWTEARHGHGHGVLPAWASETLGFLMIALPAGASLCVSLVSINEWKRRVERYEEMIEFLEETAVRVKHTGRRETLERLVVETERALLAENFEWYHLATKSAQT